MFSNFNAGIQIVRVLSKRGRQVSPIAPFLKKHKSSYTSSLFQVRVLFVLCMFGCNDFHVLGPEILQLQLQLVVDPDEQRWKHCL